VASNGDVSASDILKEFHYISKRNIFRRLKNLRENGNLIHGRIRGKGKRPRYSIPEEKGTDIWVRAIPHDFDRKNPRIINAKVTQRNLSQMISEAKRFYQEELKKSKKKKEPYDRFVLYHIAVASTCMTWILQLTWAINAGVFSKSNNKLNLAYRNRERYEEFLSQIIYNLKIRDEETFKSISSTIYNELAHLPLIDVFYPEMKANWELIKPPPMPLH